MTSNVSEEELKAMADLLDKLSELDPDISSEGIDVGGRCRVIKQDNSLIFYIRDE